MERHSALPLLKEPKDDLRNGLCSLKDEASSRHPVEGLAVNASERAQATQQRMLGNLYGSALPARMQIEALILNRVQRLPGIPSSKLGLEALSGGLDEFDFESYLGLETETETVPADLHSQLEAKLGLQTKKATRGFF